MIRVQQPSSISNRLIPVICKLAALTLAIVLCLSSIEHLRNPWYFLNSVFQYKILWGYVCVSFAITIPMFQFVLSATLFSFTYLRGSFTACMCLFTMFLIAQLVTLWRGLDIACGCWGTFSEQITWKTILFDVALIVVSGIGMATSRFKLNRKIEDDATISPC